MEAGDLFKFTDGTSWVGAENLFSYPTGCFESVDDGYEGHNIKCNVDGAYSIIVFNNNINIDSYTGG